MRLFASLVLMFMLIVPVYAQDASSDDVPYLYYYSNVLKGIVIERADGTDSFILGRGLVEENVQWSRGPGWSTDGTWFAWHTEPEPSEPLVRTVAKGYAVSINGQILSILSEFPCVYEMHWHPTDNILLVYGNVAQDTRAGACIGNSAPLVATYWLIDANNQALLATFSFGPMIDTAFGPVIYWDESNELIHFRVVYNSFAGGEFVPYRYFVTMHFNGEVQMQPISSDGVSFEMSRLTPTLSDRDRPTEFTSRFASSEYHIEDVPPSVDWDGGHVARQWDESRRLLLVGHELCRAGCHGVVEEVSIFNPRTGTNRELSDCGEYPSCVGWLPERIDIDALPLGQPESVLPTPISIEYSDERSYSWQVEDRATHQLICNQENQRLELVIDQETDSTDFVLPVAERCRTLIQREPEVSHEIESIVFALSPNEAYFAITDVTKYTSLYDTESGALIVTLNFYGEELAFSDDSQFLITSSTTVTATWDIQELIANHSD